MSNELSDEEINEKLEELDIWGIDIYKLVTRVEFDNYMEAVFFANAVFSIAQEEFHHPEVKVEYGAVEIDLWDHEAEGITEKDLEMAERIEKKVKNIEWEDGE
jgi:4a-hydroxytetrahydrobiopterin dehydratase